jgi:hypothetical protein
MIEVGGRISITFGWTAFGCWHKPPPAHLPKLTSPEKAYRTAKHLEKSVLYLGDMRLRFFSMIGLAASVDCRCNLFLLPRDRLIAAID